MLFSCARDNTIKQWNLTTGEGVCSITTAHKEFMMSLVLHTNYLFSGGLDGQVIGAVGPPKVSPTPSAPPSRSWTSSPRMQSTTLRRACRLCTPTL